ncbi:MAG TPA: type II CAAX endopeptidase family protein [Longimicrobiales bacterium]|nr:type II CAAX endopeptidase family protein [Longimicrobiales bacterium]
MLREEQHARGFGWVGAVARIAAWIGLSILFGVATGMAVAFVAGEVVAGAAGMAGGTLIAGAVLIRGVDGRSPAALGIALSSRTLPDLGIGLMIGAGGLAVAALLMLVTGSLAYATQDGTAAGWAGVVIAQAGLFTLAAFAEEVAFRGYGFQVLARVAGAPAAIAVSSVLFALAHGANPEIGAFALVNIFLAGILLAVAYLRTLSLWFATALHMGWNWAMATLFDLPVSGIAMFDTPLYQPRIDGAAWWSGGAFGPEGGMVGTIGFAAALLLTLRWRAVRRDPAIVQAAPLVLDRERSGNDG